MNRRHTVLIVDDEPDLVQSVQDLLRLDYHTFGATSADEALELLRDRECHVVMTDQRMPEMSGVELLSKVRQMHPDAVRLLFTGYADIKAVIDAINKGHVFRYIAKPWEPEELQAVIRQSVDQYQLLAERRRLVADLLTANERLELSNAELVRANNLKEAFIRVASHELRTPLTILNGLTELALSTAVDGAELDWLRRIHSAGGRLQRIVQQLTKLLAAGHFDRPAKAKRVEPAELVRQAVKEVSPFLERRKQELQLVVADNCPALWVDPEMIHDALDNLLLNAIKFTPDQGKVTITVQTTDASTVQVQVADTGVGISPEHLPHIFKPFFTGFDVSRHVSGHFEFGRRGIGLGLTIAKTFVEMHGGQIDVRSDPGRGSRFTMFLPAARPEDTMA